MRPIQTAFRIIAATALAMLAVSCASTGGGLEEEKRLAFSAGFKVITPVKADQVAILKTLPKNQVTPITYKGKTYFILPDAEHNEAFVGGQIEFRYYQKLRMNKERDDNIAAAEMSQMEMYNQMNWGAWGGWGALGPIHTVPIRR
ncbi:MAG: hypothetical protein ACAH88_18010 [Roseimicrobium sp.]